MASTALLAQRGVNMVNVFFTNNNWLFRNQLEYDFGIDAMVEIFQDRMPTGSLFGIQIKTGDSYFKEEKEDNYIFRTDNSHITYWLKHCLPVILVLCNDKSKEMYWVQILKGTVIATEKGWKVMVPKKNVLSPKSILELKKITQPNPYYQMLFKLQMDRQWIKLIASGEEVYLEFEDWINKSFPRYNFRLKCQTKDKTIEDNIGMKYCPDFSIEKALSHFFPWADYNTDEESYKDYLETQWESECYFCHDKETDEYHYTMPFEEWYENNRKESRIKCIGSNGEVDYYVLTLSLNDIGESLAILDEFLTNHNSHNGHTFQY